MHAYKAAKDNNYQRAYSYSFIAATLIVVLAVVYTFGKQGIGISYGLFLILAFILLFNSGYKVYLFIKNRYWKKFSGYMIFDIIGLILLYIWLI